MRKSITIITVVIFITFISFSSPRYIYAHFLEADRNIGAVLHIDPDDDPIVGQQAGFFFEFKDKASKLKPENCNCIFAISENGATIFSQDLFQNNSNPSLTNANIFFTFPQKDVYQVKITGQPLHSGDFQSFSLIWNIRVDRESNHGEGGVITKYFNYILIVTVLMILFTLFIFRNIIQRQKKKGEKSHEKDIRNIY